MPEKPAKSAVLMPMNKVSAPNFDEKHDRAEKYADDGGTQRVHHRRHQHRERTDAHDEYAIDRRQDAYQNKITDFPCFHCLSSKLPFIRQSAAAAP